MRTIEEIRQSLDREPSAAEVLAEVIHVQEVIAKLSGKTWEELTADKPATPEPSNSAPAPQI
jgi:hypothetical protein